MVRHQSLPTTESTTPCVPATEPRFGSFSVRETFSSARYTRTRCESLGFFQAAAALEPRLRSHTSWYSPCVVLRTAIASDAMGQSWL